MAEHTLDIATFRLLYPAFADVTKYPDAYVQAQFTAATSYLGKYDGPLMCGDDLQLALYLMTAHLMQLNVMLTAGGATPTIGIMTSATIDKVTVTNMPPPIKSGWAYWLCLTPYGTQLWALLRRLSAGGLYIGGRPERAAFRKVGGFF